jgi:hypothetical protein
LCKKYLEIQASILLGKLFFSQMRIEEAYKILNGNKVYRTLTEQIARLKAHPQEKLDLAKLYSLREMQIYAEGHSIKGLCLEKKHLNQAALSPAYKHSEEAKKDEQDVIDYFEGASRFAIEHSLLAQKRMLASHQSSPTNTLSNASSSGQQASTSGAAGSALNSGDAVNNPTLSSLNNNEDNFDLINPLYEIALQKAPILYIKKGLVACLINNSSHEG